MTEAKRLHTPTGTPPSHSTLMAEDHSQSILQSLQKLFNDEQLCDYTIIAEGQSFKTHRNILAAVSDYFRVMLTGDMLESRQDHVELKGVSANAVRNLLNFAYTGKLTLNLDDVMEILAGACHLQMRSAIDLCSQFLEGEISVKSCVDILNIAEMYTLMPVKEMALEFLLPNFEKVAETEQFFKLHKDDLCMVLKSNLLVVQNELTLFNHVVKWIHYDLSERCVDAYDLMQHIRFALMKPEELVDHVSQTFAMLKDPQCQTFLQEALHYHVLPNRHPMMQSSRTQVRSPPTLVAFGGRYGYYIGYKHNSNRIFALHEGRWVPLPNTDTNFLYASVAVVDNFMYVCGGMGKPAHARATCQRYDPRIATWVRLSHMKTRRQSFPLVPFKGKLYAFGGGSPVDMGLDHPPCDKCEVYSIDKNEWTFISSLPAPRKSSSGCEYGGKIYISGGRTVNETMSTLWCYDPENDQWEERSPMLIPHAGHAMITVEDKMYVIDRNNVGIESYDPLADEWTKIRGPVINLSGVARPTSFGPWVYFCSYVSDNKDYQCKRFNVLTQESEDLPDYPDEAHCVIGAHIAIPRTFLLDANNNP